ncbi:virginiamycin B lyase family protein [Streptomyces violens]|uniref:Vgb family protein n=1 Tax=Streptomyces violens TaxID=66377 RepID=UPI000AEC2969|nr:hydrolase [Streptomyces violens]
MIRLPGNAFLADLVVSDNGTLWVAQSRLSAIAEISPAGKVTQHPLPRGPGYPPYPYDLQESPDGGIWYTAGDQLGRLGPSGKFTWWDDSSYARPNGPGGKRPGFPDALTLGPDNTIWFGHSAPSSYVFARADTKRGLHRIALVKGDFDVPVRGMATGPDGAVWFSQQFQYDEDQRDGIGRLTAEGKYKEWPLPKGTAPQSIVAGPDKALWFTERRGIGRIGTDGRFSHFRVRASDHPGGIVLGPDKALWFTTDHRVGRITTKGGITLWPVRGAKNLTSIAPTPEGSFWLADRETDTLRRFTPPR